jgi:hypothetical protein
MPSSVPHRRGITCLRGCDLRPSTKLKWPESLPLFQVAVSTTVESVLGRLPNDTFRVEVVSELATEFWKMEDWHLWLEQPAARISDLLLGPPSDRARLADRLNEAAE